MNERPIDRLRTFINYLKGKEVVYGYKDFEDSCGISSMYINNMLRGKGNIGIDVICRVHAKFPELSILWLCTGEGDMIDYRSATKKEIADALERVKSIEKTLKELMDSI